MDYENLLRKTPRELLSWLTDNFQFETMQTVNSVEDMQTAGELLLHLANAYSYLCCMLSFAKILTREYKRTGTKTEYEDMVDKKEIVSNMVDSIKQQYQAISRAVTIKIENNNELRMTGDAR